MNWLEQLGLSEVNKDARPSSRQPELCSGDKRTSEGLSGQGRGSVSPKRSSGRKRDEGLPCPVETREVDCVRAGSQELDGGDSGQSTEVEAVSRPEQVRRSGPPEVEALRVGISRETYALGFTLAELQLIVMAAAYEIFDSPVASDATFDTLCQYTETPHIPGFSVDTGQWVHKVMTKELADLTEWCIEKVASVEHDDTCHHSYIWEYFRNDQSNTENPNRGSSNHPSV